MRVQSTTPGIYLEFTPPDDWKINVRGNSSDIDLENSRVVLSLLPFLEAGSDFINSQINNENMRNTFPMDKCIESGFINGSEHWCACAMDALEAKDEKVIERYITHLKKITENKKSFRQRIRHQAHRLISKWKKWSEQHQPDNSD